MPKLLIAALLLTTIAFAKGGDSSPNTDIEILEIPASVGTMSTGGVDRIEVYGLPKGSEIISLSRGWRVVGQQGDMTAVQGPPTNQPTTIKFTSPNPKWKVSVVGYKGRKSIWNIGSLTRDSISFNAVKADSEVSSSQHQQTDLNFLGERAKVSSNVLPGSSKRGDFSCPDGTKPYCLDSGDKACPSSTKCVNDEATCFDDYPCDLSDGFFCASQYDNVLNDCKDVVRQYNELASENLDLRERRMAQKNCVINACTLEEARTCVR
jgi:hypothetical protein